MWPRLMPCLAVVIARGSIAFQSIGLDWRCFRRQGFASVHSLFIFNSGKTQAFDGKKKENGCEDQQFPMRQMELRNRLQRKPGAMFFFLQLKSKGRFLFLRRLPAIQFPQERKTHLFHHYFLPNLNVRRYGLLVTIPVLFLQ